MDFRIATATDIPQLAFLNAALIRDEGHRNRLTVAELEARMRKFLNENYVAVVFIEDGKTAGYALYRIDEEDGVFLRQFFVVPHARRRGLGREAVQWLCAQSVAGCGTHHAAGAAAQPARHRLLARSRLWRLLPDDGAAAVRQRLTILCVRVALREKQAPLPIAPSAP